MEVGKKMVITGSILAAIAVILGAMAAHALKSQLEPSTLESFKTAVKFQMYHALAMLAMAGTLKFLRDSMINWIFNFMLTGTVIFSGSIYLLTTGPLMGISFSFLGPFTPLGGMLLITSWILMAVAAIRND
jgi:uncharacterized membrane protein YgdD (TMEM256/DUF423 family)